MKNDEAYYERVAKEINLLSVNHNIDTGEISCNVSFDYQAFKKSRSYRSKG